jgi:hypothetical protein
MKEKLIPQQTSYKSITNPEIAYPQNRNLSTLGLTHPQPYLFLNSLLKIWGFSIPQSLLQEGETGEGIGYKGRERERAYPNQMRENDGLRFSCDREREVSQRSPMLSAERETDGRGGRNKKE